jgi:hypothetical protein
MIPAELAARRYIDLWSERDPTAGAALVEACFAANCRFVTRRRTFHGRAEVAAMIDAALADPRGLTARLTSVIDAGGDTFRFRAIIEYADGSRSLEGLDVGEVDVDGRIIVLYTFAGPLADAPPAP